ncbi:MAG: hypothetical protein UW37_C0014G0012 [Candidatus Gottesmanbacteria bacterium GW2011_GWA2_44_17]|uniref:Uncharacterized protein n=2 Tax=Candidatus Gottesmaniibacteriota TaxID=1752720 RepID=A0A0G1HJA4_9BACT|nr:MAG: hypothetical protein UV63_C0038G0018 [Microgenomates group bacterium GW2011_GWC1_43_11]KKT38709.1 MAG: hypothetical protein UW22_C0007G0012 [Candidatus Gottesmanbacteria bacterium GW2011_GWB1_44_11c]KKT47030.1 MAG: hypothetical protein UW37_C0014G0012 [Candidatus Gottesmanbacteria bacterium GW2011_GWA2_44_17]
MTRLMKLWYASNHVRIEAIETSLPGMPKKTKKEKIIAEYRRKLSIVSARPEATEIVTRHDTASAPTSGVPTFSLQHSPPKNEHSDAIALDPHEFLAIKKDLLMTLILTGCILIGQIILWRVIG